MTRIIDNIGTIPSVIGEMAWKTVTQRLTDCYRKFAYTPLRIYPSHYFISRRLDYRAETETFLEDVHPDHNVWYTRWSQHAAEIQQPRTAPEARPAARIRGGGVHVDLERVEEHIRMGKAAEMLAVGDASGEDQPRRAAPRAFVISASSPLTPLSLAERRAPAPDSGLDSARPFQRGRPFGALPPQRIILARRHRRCNVAGFCDELLWTC